MYELIILGGGPAGMTAAVYAARKKLNTLFISKDLGGQPLRTAGIENYMGYQYIEGPELMRKFQEQMGQFPIEQKVGPGAERVSKVDGGFEVKTTEGETYQARAVIVATGKRPRMLNVPGEVELAGRGVTYCSICDGPIFEGQKVAVIGGGNSALEAVNDMVKIGEHVYMVSITPLTGDPILIDRARGARNLTILTEHQVVDIQGKELVEAIRIRPLKGDGTQRLEVGGVFIEIGLVPNSDLVRGLAKLNAAGEVMVDCSCRTDVPGLFAAGDVTDVPEKQIVVAAGEGAKAALQAHRYLQRL